jgi:hypothetical protein
VSVCLTLDRYEYLITPGGGDGVERVSCPTPTKVAKSIMFISTSKEYVEWSNTDRTEIRALPACDDANSPIREEME